MHCADSYPTFQKMIIYYKTSNKQEKQFLLIGSLNPLPLSELHNSREDYMTTGSRQGSAEGFLPPQSSNKLSKKPAPGRGGGFWGLKRSISWGISRPNEETDEAKDDLLLLFASSSSSSVASCNFTPKEFSFAGKRRRREMGSFLFFAKRGI